MEINTTEQLQMENLVFCDKKQASTYSKLKWIRLNDILDELRNIKEQTEEFSTTMLLDNLIDELRGD